MITIQTVTPALAMLLKATRLRALEDTPAAFGSTYARESAFSDHQWIERAGQWSNGITSTGFLAIEHGQPCGIAAGYFEAKKLDVANLVSMWVAPSHRRQNVGRMLVEAVMEWREARSAQSVQLDVVNNNAGAIEFYQSLGFTMTGNTKPYPNDPALVEYEMAIAL